MSTSDETDGDPSTPASAQEAIDRIDARANALRDKQIRRALTRLDERGDLTPKKRVVVAALADRLTTKLVESPKAGLRTAAESAEKRTTEVAFELFGD